MRSMRSKGVHLDLAARFAFCALLLAVPDSAFAQPADPTPVLPPLPAPEDEPAPPPTAPSAPVTPVPAPATPPPTRVASPSAGSPQQEPATTPILTLGDIPKLVVASIGLGVSVPIASDVNASGDGFYASGEFVLVPNLWVSARFYGGLLLTSTNSSTCSGATPCNVGAKIGFLGAKGRLTFPIPYVAPFFEVGGGVSAGTITTEVDGIVAKDFAGLTYHIPFALGLSLGEMHHYIVDIALSYLAHPAVSQVDGAFAVSLAFPLK